MRPAQLSKHAAFQESTLHVQKRLVAQISFKTSTNTCTTLHNEMALDHFIGTKKLMTAECSGLLRFTIKIKQCSKDSGVQTMWSVLFGIFGFKLFQTTLMRNNAC